MVDIRISAAVVTVSDSRSEKTDRSGPALAELVETFGGLVVERRIVTDDAEEVRAALIELSDRDDVNLVLTTGGTGFAPRDNTPEATRSVIEKEAPGISELIRAETYRINPRAVLSRGVSGLRNRTLIINLPGSERGVRECFEVLRPLLQHAVNLVSGETRH